MIRAIRSLLHRPVHGTAMARDPRSRFRDPRFVSFMASSNRKTLDTDFQDAILQGRRVLKQVLVVLLAAGGAWVLVESARALTLF
jgi:hypothetical protein